MKKTITRGLLILAGLLLLLAFSLFTTVDMTPYREMPYYKRMAQRVYALPDTKLDSDTLKVGWAKVNLSPAYPVPIAIAQSHGGKSFERIEDSIWVRAFVFDNGLRKAAFVTMDLMIVPPTVTELLNDSLRALGFSLNNTYLTATHTHNSIGAWGPGYVGKIFAGKYDQQVVNHIVHCITEAIKNADAEKARAKIGYADVNAPELVYNRLVGDKGTTDPWLHILKVVRDDGKTALLANYAAHATCLPADYMNLHRDYPGKLVDLLEHWPGIDFAAYSAGAVGSMGPVFRNQKPFAEKDSMAVNVFRKIAMAQDTLRCNYTTTLNSFRLPLELRGQNFRVTNRISFRPWVTKRIVGEYPLTISMLRVGNVVYTGMPCDFSGELTAEPMKVAATKNLHLAVTSFNGGYMGYITDDKWYDMNAYETRTMNWYGPYNGAYLTEVIERMLEKI